MIKYPNIYKEDFLEYEWSGYSKVFLFTSKDRFIVVQNWFQNSEDFDVEEHFIEEGSTQIDFLNKETNEVEYELLLVSKEMFEDGLETYMASEKLKKMAKTILKPKTIGCLFKIEKEDKTEPVNQANSETPVGRSE